MSNEEKRERLNALRHRFAKDSDGVLETIAAETGVSTQEAHDCLPDAIVDRGPGAAFEEVMNEVATWGPVTLLVHTPDVILECKGALPPGKISHGYFNLMGPGPIGGHIRHENCNAIYFVRRKFMGADSCSIVFFNGLGEPMFKVFVGRDEQRQLPASQVEKFDLLRQRLGHCQTKHSRTDWATANG